MDELNQLRSSLGDTNKDLQDLASLRAELETTRKQLQSYKSQEAADPVVQLQAKDDLLRTAELKSQQSAQVLKFLINIDIAANTCCTGNRRSLC